MIENQSRADGTDTEPALQEAYAELESLAYVMSHDVRTPLRTICGLSDAVVEDFGHLLPEEGREYLGLIRDVASRASVQLDALLTLSRLSRQPLNSRLVDSSALVAAALAELEAMRLGRSIDIRVASLPPCHGDAELLHQVWLNLLSNAIKFTRTRSEARVEVGSDDGNYWVRDNGVGFDMRYAGKLFGIFQKLHVEDPEGTGIGLAVVARIVKRHGGRVWADADVEKGATFYFTLAG